MTFCESVLVFFGSKIKEPIPKALAMKILNIEADSGTALTVMFVVVMHSNDKIRKYRSIQELCTALNATHKT